MEMILKFYFFLLSCIVVREGHWLQTWRNGYSNVTDEYRSGGRENVRMLLNNTDISTGKYFSMCRTKEGNGVNFFLVRDLQNSTEAALEKYTQGKISILVNVASFCGLTRQYIQFNSILSELPNTLRVVGFPCDQFGHQEPGVNSSEILNTIHYVRPGSGFNLHPQFHLMLRGDINGKKELSLYTYLKSVCPQPDSAYFKSSESSWEPIKLNDITWNFEKFLIDKMGRPLYRFRPQVEPFDLVEIIKATDDHSERNVDQDNRLSRLLHDLDVKVEQRHH